MNVKKQVLASLEKCYAVTEFTYDGERHLICAAEKKNPCYAFNLAGEKVDQLWEGPGGVMTLLQYPLEESVLMATQLFYSPNDSASAKIVYYTHDNGSWNCHVLCELPFVHRFGIVERGGVFYLVACSLKSAHAFKNDWTCPGRIWVAELPADIRKYNAEHPLSMTPVMSGLFKNHGFSICREGNDSFAVVGTENGIYQVTPPAERDGEWSVECLMDTPASDMLFEDFDGDGQRELLVISPFHGDTVKVYHRTGDGWEAVYEVDHKMPFCHAIYSGKMDGRMTAFVGNREEKKELLMIWFDPQRGWQTEVIDEGAGPANCFYLEDNGRKLLLTANRESDEVALYELS